jgi:hypothetical protein
MRYDCTMSEALDLLAAKWELRLIDTRELVAAAGDALRNSDDSPSLLLLASLTAAELEEAPTIFRRALDELGLAHPTTSEAVMRVAEDVSRRVLEGATTPYEAAKEIARVARRGDEHLPQLDSFLYAESEWDERPEDGNIFAEGVVAAARDLVR